MINYDLFKTFCMPLYGVQLWDFSSASVNKFIVAWIKCIHRLLMLPLQAHCSLLNIICNDYSAEIQLHKRFLKCIHSNLTSKNKCIQTCSRIVLSASKSRISNSLNHVCQMYHLRKDKLSVLRLNDVMNTIHHTYMSKVNIDDVRKASFISELLNIRENMYNTELTADEINFMINELCTS
jgi:hypothetical protein